MNFVVNYLEVYNNLINKAKNRNIEEEKYVEHHHIIPLSIGGEDNKNNIVALYPREHYLAHKLLHILYPKNISLQHAYCMMTFTTLDALKKYDKVTTNRYYHISSRDYEYCRILAAKFGKHMKGFKYINNGKIQKAVSKDKLNDYLNNGWCIGKLPFTEEALAKIREYAKNRKISDETRIKKSNSVIGDKNPVYGRKTINNGLINKKVFPNELDDYLNNGWKLGQILLSEKTKTNMYNARRSHNKANIEGRIYVHTEEEPYIIRYSKKEDVDFYLNNGWKLGRGPYIEQSKPNNGNHGLFMYFEEPYKVEKVQKELINYYLSKGWKLGKGTHIK